MKVRCPFCVQDFEVPVTETVTTFVEPTNSLIGQTGLNKPTLIQSLKTENENLRHENNRLSIINHYHRGE